MRIEHVTPMVIVLHRHKCGLHASAAMLLLKAHHIRCRLLVHLKVSIILFAYLVAVQRMGGDLKVIRQSSLSFVMDQSPGALLGSSPPDSPSRQRTTE
ncbi:hypothetical protein BJX76DRAFT_322383 [Aspergillus varians]